MTEASETLNTTPPAEEFELMFDGEKREVVMKFALLRELARQLPGANDTQMVFHDEIMFEQVLVTLLIPRDAKGKPDLPKVERDGEMVEADWDLDDHDFDHAEAINLVKWAMEHLIGFFLSKLTAVSTLGEQNIGQIETLLSSLPGLKGLASKKASAGPTDFSTPTSEPSTGG